jgi:hypothetical protein
MKRVAVICCLMAALIAGCGGESKQSRSPTTPAAGTPTPSPNADSPDTLRRAVRAAVHANARLSSYVLWNNVVPSWATESTSGPALRGLRSSAASRRTRGVRLRSLSQRVTILSIKLDPSYLAATVRVREDGRVAPYRREQRVGRSIRLDEHARIELRRVDKTNRFVVWKVAPTQ